MKLEILEDFAWYKQGDCVEVENEKLARRYIAKGRAKAVIGTVEPAPEPTPEVEIPEAEEEDDG